MKKKIIPLFLAAAVSVSGVLPIGAVQPVTVMAENGHPASFHTGYFFLRFPGSDSLWCTDAGCNLSSE